MYNEEDLTVASLAQLVGSELHTIDRNTESRTSNPANKIDPRAFLSKNAQSARPKNPNIVKHQGHHFHAGVDESYVQSMYPDPAPQVPMAPTLQEPVGSVQHAPARAQAVQPVMPAVTTATTQELIKILQSIDKSLKSIDKTEKALTKLVTHLTSTNSDKDTSK